MGLRPFKLFKLQCPFLCVSVCLSPPCNFLTEFNGVFWSLRVIQKLLNQELIYDQNSHSHTTKPPGRIFILLFLLSATFNKLPVSRMRHFGTMFELKQLLCGDTSLINLLISHLAAWRPNKTFNEFVPAVIVSFFCFILPPCPDISFAIKQFCQVQVGRVQFLWVKKLTI